MASTNDTLPITYASSASKEEFNEAVYGRVFNHRRPTRQPFAVVKASSPTHVVAAVNLAIKLQTRISVRSGGHSWAAWSVRTNAILIDLGDLKTLQYDEATQIVKVSPSITGRVLNGFLMQKGRMFCGGHCPDVGLGGFLLQGGMGWNCKNWGWACEQIVGVDVVDAQGSALHCSESENEDLFWAARGAGPGFPAIVTAFHLKTRPSVPVLHKGIYIYPLSFYDKILPWVLSISPSFSPCTEIVCVSAYPTPDSPSALLHCMFLSFAPTASLAMTALTPAWDSHPEGAIVAERCVPTTLNAEYDDQAIANPQGHRYTADNAYISNDLSPTAVTSLLKPSFTTLPNAQTFALYFAMSPTSRRPLPSSPTSSSMALSLQSDHYFALYTVWKQASDDTKYQSWVKNVMKDVEKGSSGAYLGDSDFDVRRTRFWGEEEGKRLKAVREKWDPLGRICGFLMGDDEGQGGSDWVLENVLENEVGK